MKLANTHLHSIDKEAVHHMKHGIQVHTAGKRRAGEGRGGEGIRMRGEKGKGGDERGE